ncbi:MAG TPA: ATP-binding protein [Vulgatibacter sp.]
MTHQGILQRGLLAAPSIRTVAIVVGFLLFAILGDRVAGQPGLLEIRPVVGLALACLILAGPRASPAVWLGASLFAVVIHRDGWPGASTVDVAALSAVSGLVVTAVALLGAWAMRRFVVLWNPFASAVGVLRYATVAAGLGVLGGSARALLYLAFRPPPDGQSLGHELLHLILGDLASFLVIVPLLVILSRAPPPALGGKRLAEIVLLLGLLLGVCLASFRAAPVLGLSQTIMVLLLIPLSLWAALRHGQWGAVISVVMVISFAAWGTRRGVGAFVEEEGAADADLMMKVFVIVISLSAHVLAAVLAELAHSRDELERRVEERTEERDRLLVEERAARAAAEESILVRDTFLSVASHELKTPLTSLQLHLQSIIRANQLGTGPIAAPLQRKLEVASRQVKRVAVLVDELLDVSRISANRLVLEPEEVDLTQTIRELTRRFADDFASAGSPLHVSGLTRPILGSWDAIRLDQVLSNLLANALKYGAGKQIEIAAIATDQDAMITITDHGIGIAPEDQARIFERFQRAVGTGNYGGLGLGLWIVRQIVEAMGGVVTVESELGKGSTFGVRLPRWAGRSETAAG